MARELTPRRYVVHFRQYGTGMKDADVIYAVSEEAARAAFTQTAKGTILSVERWPRHVLLNRVGDVIPPKKKRGRKGVY